MSFWTTGATWTEGGGGGGGAGFLQATSMPTKRAAAPDVTFRRVVIKVLRCNGEGTISPKSGRQKGDGAICHTPETPCLVQPPAGYAALMVRGGRPCDFRGSRPFRFWASP